MPQKWQNYKNKVKFPRALHASCTYHQVMNTLLTRMQKIIPPLLTLMIHLALRNFIFMMRKCEIYATGMDVQLLSKHCTVTIFSWSVSRTLQKLVVKKKKKKRWSNINMLFNDCNVMSRKKFSDLGSDLGYQNCSRTMCMSRTISAHNEFSSAGMIIFSNLD